MKVSFRCRLTVALAVTAGSLIFPSGSSYSQPTPGQSGFWCDTSSGSPATLYRNRQGGVEPWIYWTSNVFSASGYDPMTRCQMVSSRLETYRRNRQLQYITVGQMNGMNVICTASEVNGRCEGLVYTLKPGQNPVRTLNNFLAWREGQAGTPSLYEGTGQRQQKPYIDVRARLGEGSGQPPTSTVPPTSPVNPLPQPTIQPETLREL